MRGLTVIVAEPSPERFRVALALAAATAALGRRAQVFCQGAAVSVLRPPIFGDQDATHAAVGLPTLAELFEEALALGVELVACQSGIQLTATNIATLDPRIAHGGLVSMMQTLGEDRLVIA